jgi:hypothetical protein
MQLCVNWPMNLERSLLGAALVALCSVGCSDSGYRLGGASSLEAAARARRCSAGAEFELIDDMEDGDGAILLVEQRAGVWFSFNDKSGGEQFPASDQETFVMSELDPPRPGSRRAARSYGHGFSEWGAGVGFELMVQKAYDVSRYAGITFLAKRDESATNATSAVRFAVTDVATTPRGYVCEHDQPEPHCSDYFGAYVNLTPSFRRYSFEWQDLHQEGFGFPAPPSVDTSQVYGVRFQVDKNLDFDFWIDDIALICKRE